MRWQCLDSTIAPFLQEYRQNAKVKPAVCRATTFRNLNEYLIYRLVMPRQERAGVGKLMQTAVRVSVTNLLPSVVQCLLDPVRQSYHPCVAVHQVFCLTLHTLDFVPMGFTLYNIFKVCL
jgi:hypothetical protein